MLRVWYELDLGYLKHNLPFVCLSVCLYYLPTYLLTYIPTYLLTYLLTFSIYIHLELLHTEFVIYKFLLLLFLIFSRVATNISTSTFWLAVFSDLGVYRWTERHVGNMSVLNAYSSTPVLAASSDMAIAFDFNAKQRADSYTNTFTAYVCKQAAPSRLSSGIRCISDPHTNYRTLCPFYQMHLLWDLIVYV